MKSVYASMGFALGASAAALLPRDQCCFGLTASGGVSGKVGQLGDGQNRIAQTAGLDKQTGQYCLSNGQITDGSGRGCILTPPTTQFQCDVGATGTGGFSVDNGNLVHNGNGVFYACPTGDNGGYNIYTTPVANQQGCVTISLSTGGQCSASSSAPASKAPATTAPASSAPASSAPASSAPAPSTPVEQVQTVYRTFYETISACPASSTAAQPKSSAPASSAPAAPASSAPATPVAPAPAGSACPAALSGAYQTPHAIIPVNKNAPAQSYGTQYNAYVGGGNSTIFNFDIPASYSGKQCSVIFLFPEQKDLVTSSFTESGSGSLTFSQLSSVAGLDVSYNTCPSVKSQLGQVNNVAPGNSYVVSTGACPAGTTESIEVSASGDYQLEFFEDWNPSPIGVFISSC